MLKHKDLIEQIKDPFDLFKQWYDLACETEINDPNAMTLSTVFNNQPSSRVVL
jgi:Pyridoxamine-phosphate oxidase